MAAKESSVCPSMRFCRHCRSMTAICRRLFLLLKPLWINLAAISLRCAVNEESPACDRRMRRMFAHAISQSPLMQINGICRKRSMMPARSNKSQHASAQASFPMQRSTFSDQDHLVQREDAILPHLHRIPHHMFWKHHYSPLFPSYLRVQYRPLR